MIEMRVDEKLGLTIHVCTGKLSAEEIKDEIKKFYDGADPTPHNLWDLLEALVMQYPPVDQKPQSGSLA